MPNRDNAPILDLVLDRLASNTNYENFELLVVDDGSTDGSREILRRWRDSDRFAAFRLVEIEHGDGGVVDALNTGLKQAEGELVVQLDADASIETPNWLRRMVAFFTADPRIGVVTGRVVTDTGLLQACGIEVVGPKGYHDRSSEIIEGAGSRTSYQHVKRFREDEWPACERIAEVDGGMGVCMMYRRDTAMEVGGYDRGYAPVWLDDLDLTISVRRQGLKVFYLPDVRAVHHLRRRARPDDQQAAPSLARRTSAGIRRGVGAALPASARAGIVRTLGWDQGTRSYRQRLARHYEHWRTKWGWDLLNPDIQAIHERWGDTEICWRETPPMREAGESIIAAFEAAQAGSVGRADPPQPEIGV